MQQITDYCKYYLFLQVSIFCLSIFLSLFFFGCDDSSDKDSGPSVKIAVILDVNTALGIDQDDLIAGDNAAVKTINETLNGLGGSGIPVKLVFFDTGMDTAKTTEIANQVAADQSFVAVVGGLYTNEINPILEEAGLPVIPSVACTKDEYISPNVFQLNGGHVTMSAGPINSALEAGATNPLSITSYLVGIPWYGDVNNLIRDKYGLAPETELNMAPWTVTQAEMEDLVAKVCDPDDGLGDGAILSLIANVHTIMAIQARYDLGITAPFIIQGMAVNPKVIESMGEAGEGILVAQYFPTPDSDLDGEKRYLASMSAAGYDDFIGDKSQMGWVAFDLLNYATQGLTTFTRESIMNALSNVTDYTGGGLTPTIDFTQDGPGSGYPRIYNWTYFPAKIMNGELVAAEEEAELVQIPYIDASEVDFLGE